ncbi:MAG TPA: universal stress protein [Amaricoccus sp.]|uniref:universal stress protein n=1 Tax=Amaricoccus sp. TaxID=1872485 RepID=UPI002C60CB8F|nr:universal stress protein [Amaricoccus sp.]HMQ93030.1 universal stress protein [Amaricoccus sp.]HMR53362.1 universal stress protein [Amaricoccus sp.]HMR59779.1 universal stress protein [Amaricoccus sp.]HMU00322.1 universal stress protein [Amaricoccus sp.]
MSGEPGPASRDTILCAVDFSGDSAAALGWACRQAVLTDARLVLLHVVHDPASSPGFYRRVGSAWLEPMIAVAEDMMAEFLAAFRAEDLPAPAGLETRLVRGLPPGRIVEVARELGADLVVVGSRGRTGLPHILLGSVAERVVQTAPMPVTVVKRRDAAPA